MSIAHLASWLVAVSLVPMLSAKLPPPKFIGRETLITRLRDRLRPLHRLDAAAPPLDDGRVIALLAAQHPLPMTHTKKDMFDAGESRRLFLRFQLNANYPPGGTEDPSVAQDRELPRRNRADSRSRRSTPATPRRAGDTFVSLIFQVKDRSILFADKSRQFDTEQIMEEIRKDLPKVLRSAK